MRYFISTTPYEVAISVVDDMNIDAVINPQYQYKLDEMLKAVEPLRAFDSPIFTAGRLAFFFPKIQEVSQPIYADVVASIRKKQDAAAALRAELDQKSQYDLMQYVTRFPVSNPELVSYDDIHDLFAALNELDEVNALTADGPVEETSDENLKIVYSLLRNTELNSDNTVIRTILTNYRM